MALRIFRNAGRVRLTFPAGGLAEGRGIVAPLRQKTEEPGGNRHALGVLERPLSHFIGWLPETEGLEGGVLAQGGQAYTVLEVRPISLGERQVCVRALLEPREREEAEV